MIFPPPAGEVFVIAEIGINHEGSVETCVRMIDVAMAAGADAVKLQTIDPDKNYVRGTESHTIFSQACLNQEQTAEVFTYARTCGIACFTTVGDFETLEWINRLEPVAHKISSGLLTHTALIQQAAATGRPIILSTGMSDGTEIGAALVAVAGQAPAILLQCTSIYPAPEDSINLRAIGWMAERFGVPCGFSDHSLGTDVASMAVAAGAMCIEKHLTLDPSRAGFDHPISLGPQQFAQMVDSIRRTQLILGVAGKPLTGDLRQARERYLRCVVANEPIPAGTPLSVENMAVKRPLPNRRGIAADQYKAVLGRRALVDIEADEPITPSSIED